MKIAWLGTGIDLLLLHDSEYVHDGNKNMFTINASTRAGLRTTSRRTFLQASGLGMSLKSALHAAEGTWSSGQASGFGRARRCIQVFLWGGPSQLDTWDMKPEAPEEIRGPLSPISTSVPGLGFSELLPLSSRFAHLCKVVRTVAHEHNEHSSALHTMGTGTPYPAQPNDVVAASPDDHPHLGSICAHWMGWRRGRPPFVQMPQVIGPPRYAPWPGQGPGFLGKKRSPLVVKGDRQTATFSLPAIHLPRDVSGRRLDERRSLRDQLDHVFQQTDATAKAVTEMEALYDQAYSLVGTSSVRQALDLDQEPDSVRDHYGRHLFGQGLLLARRLSEAGIPLVNVYWIDPEPAGEGGGEFDSHGRIYHHYPKRLLPPTDRALAALLEDVHDRGLLEDTLVTVMGEFGRTPRITGNAGRDHWAQCQSILLAGAGISGGSVYGRSDHWAAYPASDPVSSVNLAQTLLHLLGVPSDLELENFEGRPIPACRGRVLSGLFA